MDYYVIFFISGRLQADLRFLCRRRKEHRSKILYVYIRQGMRLLRILKKHRISAIVTTKHIRITVLLERYGSPVLTTGELATQCGITPRQAEKSLRYLMMPELIRVHRALDDRKSIHVFQKMK